MSATRTALLSILLAGAPLPSMGKTPSLNVMLAEQPRSMDPADQTATETRSVLAVFYETLVKRDASGSLRPGLATAWHASDDGLTWTFDIRQGVLFHDGSACDASAISQSLQRLIDPQKPLSGASIFRSIIKNVEAQDQAVVIKLAHSYPDFPALISLIQSAIVSPKAVNAGGIARHADGTGPYQFVAWHSGEDVRASRNPRYWGPAPFFGKIEWRWSPEPSVLNMALQTGDADVAIPLAPVFTRLYDKPVPQNSNIPTNTPLVRSVPGATLFWVALNTRLKPLNDARVRRALSLAVDRRALVQGLLAGYGRPACYALTPDIVSALDCEPGSELPRLTQAMTLLKQAGVKNGFRVAVTVQEPEEPVAEALQAMWKKIGVTLEIRRQEAGVWVQAAFATSAEKEHDGTAMVLTSWSAPYVADLQLRPLYYGAYAAPAGANLGFYVNPTIDQMIDSASEDTNDLHRNTTLKTIQTILAQDAPILPLFVKNTIFGTRQGITGVRAEADGSIVLTEAREEAKP